MPRKPPEKAPAAPPPSAVERRIVTDQDTGERAVAVRVNGKAPMTAADVAAIEDMLRAATPEGRLASLRARGEELPPDIPERALVLAVLDRASRALSSDAGFWAVDAALIEASALLERANHRGVAREKRRKAKAFGRAGGQASAEKRAQDSRHAVIRMEYEELRKTQGRNAASLIANKHGITASHVRRIVRAQATQNK